MLAELDDSKISENQDYTMLKSNILDYFPQYLSNDEAERIESVYLNNILYLIITKTNKLISAIKTAFTETNLSI